MVRNLVQPIKSYFITNCNTIPLVILAWSCLSVCPSVRLSGWENSAPIGRIFMKFDTLIFYGNVSRKLKLHHNHTEQPALRLQTDIHFASYLAYFFLE